MLQIQANFLEEFLGKKVSSIARHGPYDRDPFTSSSYMNANDPYLRGDLFVHDSCRAWTTMEDLTTLLSEPLKRVQLLVHPENWQNNKIGRAKLLERHCQILKSKTDEEKKDLLKVYRTDPLVLDYDKSIKKFKITQVDQRLPLNRRLRYDSLSIVRYHFKHTRIGWNVNKLTYKIRDIKDLFF